LKAGGEKPRLGDIKNVHRHEPFQGYQGGRKAFEDLWVTRQSHLDEVKGFQAFHLLRGPEHEDYVLYSSHTIWASQEDFTAWTKSEQFRAAHQHAGERKPLTLGHPEFEGFEVIQTIESTHPPA
jgi:heme-degrading monooxygenase HmoA